MLYFIRLFENIMFLRFVVATLLVQLANGFSSGAAGCEGDGPGIGGAHRDVANGKVSQLATFAERNVVVAVGTDIIPLGGTITVKTGTTTPIVVNGTNIKGVLMRVSGPLGYPTAGVIDLAANTQTAKACSAPAVGITHTSANDKDTVSGSLFFTKITTTVDLKLDLTLVWSNSDKLSLYSYQQYPIKVTQGPPINAPTPPPVAPPKCGFGSFTTAGSTTVLPVSAGWASEYNKLCPEPKVTALGGGSGAGARRGCNGTDIVEVASLSRPWRAIEADVASNGWTHTCKIGTQPFRIFEQVDVAIDGVPIIIERLNGTAKDCIDRLPGQSLSSAQIRWMFSNLTTLDMEPGVLTNSDNNNATKLWSELNAGCKALPIITVGPNSSYGTYDFFKEILFLQVPIGSENFRKEYVTFADNINELRDYLLNTDGAIGYLGFSYYNRNKASLRAVAVNGIEPSSDTLSKFQYVPFGRRLYSSFLKTDESMGKTKCWLDFGLSEIGATIVEQTGFLPIPAAEYPLLRARVTGACIGAPTPAPVPRPVAPPVLCPVARLLTNDNNDVVFSVPDIRTTRANNLLAKEEEVIQQEQYYPSWNDNNNNHRILVSCIKDEMQLRDAIRFATNTTECTPPTKIDICESIKITSTIMITLRNTILQCNKLNGEQCEIDAQGLSRHYVISKSHVTFINMKFINGLSSIASGDTTGPGGSMFITTSIIEFYSCTFYNNTAGTNVGGALYIDLSTVSMIGSSSSNTMQPPMLIDFNKARIGIIYVKDATLSMNYVTISNNLATYSCAGIVSLSNLILTINNTLFDSNRVRISDLAIRRQRQLSSSISIDDDNDDHNNKNEIKSFHSQRETINNEHDDEDDVIIINDDNSNNMELIYHHHQHKNSSSTDQRRKLGKVYSEPIGGVISLSDCGKVLIINTVFQNTNVDVRSSIMEIFQSKDTVTLKSIIIKNSYSKTGGSVIFLDTISKFIMSRIQFINNQWDPLYVGTIRTFDTTFTLGKNIIFRNNTLRNNRNECDYFVVTNPGGDNDDINGSCIALPIF